MSYVLIDKKKEYAVVTLCRDKANVLNAAMVTEIRRVFKELSQDQTVRGVVLTGQPDFFSAGLDVIELFDYDKAEIKEFFISFLTMFKEMVSFPKPMVAAISGHSPAGGCVMALSADYRIMADGPKYVIGLNEVAVNILIADMIPIVYSFWIGHRKAHQYLLEGRLLSVQEALDVGLIDEALPADEVLPKAETYLSKILQANQDILEGTKAALRRELIERMDMDLENYADQNMSIWWDPEVRSRMAFFVETLKARKKK